MNLNYVSLPHYILHRPASQLFPLIQKVVNGLVIKQSIKKIKCVKMCVKGSIERVLQMTHFSITTMTS